MVSRPSPFSRDSRFVIVPALAATALALSGETVLAQEAAQEAAQVEAQPASAKAPSSARRSFTPEDFARFAPRSALNMAQQIPGFSIRSGDGNRGLGQADSNVLVNGQRVSGKANGPVEALQRIPADEVVRLEILDGASLDIGGLTGQVLNVVTRSTGKVTGAFRYSAEWRSFGVPFRWGDGQVSLAGGGANSEWTLAFENNAGRRGNEGIELAFDAQGNLIDTRDEKSNFNSDRPALSGSYSRTAQNGNILNLTGQVGASINRQSEISARSGTIDPVDRLRLFESNEDGFNYEIGADYAFALGPGRLKLIGYHAFEDSPQVSVVTTSFADNRPLAGSRFTSDGDESETIARGEYSLPGWGGDWVLALEGVENSLETQSTLERRDAAGVYQPVNFEGASARVEEDRAEASVTHSRTLSDRFSLQLSAGGEYSRISQSGPRGKTRSFWRPKGFAAFDWRANPALTVSGRVERVVGQLNFFDFIATTNLDQDRVDVVNADLVPPQSWRSELEAAQALGALGSLTLRGFHEAFTDVVDQIPIPGGGESSGNAGSATVSGFEGEATILFDSLGIAGLRFDGEIGLARSEVIDPLLGTPRAISDFGYLDYKLSLRQDFPNSDWAVGAYLRGEGKRPEVRLDEIALRTERPGFARVFVEHKDVLGMTARLRAGNLIDQNDLFDRTRFLDRRAGTVDFREERRRRFGTVYSFDLEGSF